MWNRIKYKLLSSIIATIIFIIALMIQSAVFSLFLYLTYPVGILALLPAEYHALLAIHQFVVAVILATGIFTIEEEEIAKFKF